MKEINLKKTLIFLISVKTGHIIAETVARGAINALITEVSRINAEIINDIPKSRSEYMNIWSINSAIFISIGIIVSEIKIPVPAEIRIHNVNDIPKGMYIYNAEFLLFILSEIDFTVLSEICSTDTSEKINKIIAISPLMTGVYKEPVFSADFPDISLNSNITLSSERDILYFSFISSKSSS